MSGQGVVLSSVRSPQKKAWKRKAQRECASAVRTSPQDQNYCRLDYSTDLSDFQKNNHRSDDTICKVDSQWEFSG